jgi:hypothetical protein
VIDGCDWPAVEIDGPAWAAEERTNDMHSEIRLNGSRLEFARRGEPREAGPPSLAGRFGWWAPPGKICMAYRNTHKFGTVAEEGIFLLKLSHNRLSMM